MKDLDFNHYVASHVSDLPKSGIREFFELVQGREDVISLGVGEPDYVTPWHIREATIYALEKGKTSYTSNLGLKELRDEISRYVNRVFGVSYDGGREVLVTVGVSEAIDLALRALLNPGDEVLYHEPCYVSYSPSVALAHGVPVAIETRAEDEFSLKAEDIEKHLTERSKVLMLNFPTNPTGAILPRSEQEKIAELCQKHDLIVLTDEIYAELTYEGGHESIASLPGMRERCIFLHGFSKAYAMTGYRIGYACAPQPLIEAMMKIHQYSMLCASIIAQEGALEALRNGWDEMERMRDDYALRRNFVVGEFQEMGLECFCPQGAFYVFPSIKKWGMGSEEFAVKLLESENVAVVPGSAFGKGGEGFVRCCYATSMSELEEALMRIKRFLIHS